MDAGLALANQGIVVEGVGGAEPRQVSLAAGRILCDFEDFLLRKPLIHCGNTTIS